jgi:hypothetical protein
MATLIDGTKVAPHSMFYMEDTGGEETGGYEPKPELLEAISIAADDTHQPSCFALEEERGDGWKGAGATGQIIKDTRPTL